MSSTRYAAEDDPEFHQEGFASSKAYSYGLNALMVAKRASLLRKSEDRELIWFLQEISHRLDLQKHRTANYAPIWPWETNDCEAGGLERAMVDLEQIYGRKAISYEVDASSIDPSFQKETRHYWVNDLALIALDPKVATGGLGGQLVDYLRAYKKRFESVGFSNFTSTAVSNSIHRVLNYALSQRCMVLIEGDSRIGKSFSVQSWAHKNLGKARYVQLQASNDEMSFYSCIAHAQGFASSG
jgi:hypothetical protein